MITLIPVLTKTVAQHAALLRAREAAESISLFRSIGSKCAAFHAVGCISEVYSNFFVEGLLSLDDYNVMGSRLETLSKTLLAS